MCSYTLNIAHHINMLLLYERGEKRVVLEQVRVYIYIYIYIYTMVTSYIKDANGCIFTHIHLRAG